MLSVLPNAVGGDINEIESELIDGPGEDEDDSLILVSARHLQYLERIITESQKLFLRQEQAQQQFEENISLRIEKLESTMAELRYGIQAEETKAPKNYLKPPGTNEITPPATNPPTYRVSDGMDSLWTETTEYMTPKSTPIIAVAAGTCGDSYARATLSDAVDEKVAASHLGDTCCDTEIAQCTESPEVPTIVLPGMAYPGGGENGPAGRRKESEVNPAVAKKTTAAKKKQKNKTDELPKWGLAWILAKTENLVAFLIVLNAVSLGAEVHNTISSCTPKELEVKEATCKTHDMFRPIDVAFTVIFTIELVAKIWVQRSRFLRRDNPDFNWNVFDSFIVGLSLLDELISAIESVFPQGGGGNAIPLKQIKMLRLLRVVRVLRILRTIRFVRDLRVMIVGILISVKSIVWALIILIGVQYILAIVIMSFLKMSLEANAGKPVPTEERTDESGPYDREYFLDASRGYTQLNDIVWYLFLGISGGADWGDYVYPITQLSLEYEWIFRCLFMVYISFILFCVLNILTGVFVENANKLVAKDEDNMMMNEVEQRDAFNQSISRTFAHMDKNGNGTIGADEFQAICHDEKIQVLLKKIGVEITAESAPGFFQMLDFDADGVLSLDEFQQGISRLSGTAKSFDMALVLVNAKKSLGILEELVHPGHGQVNSPTSSSVLKT